VNGIEKNKDLKIEEEENHNEIQITFLGELPFKHFLKLLYSFLYFIMSDWS